MVKGKIKLIDITYISKSIEYFFRQYNDQFMQQSFNQQINGYFIDQNSSSLPESSGIYFVYECTYNLITNSVDIKQLIYIGESEDINNRINNHEKKEEWLQHVNKGNTLCFSYTLITKERERVEAAYIFKHQPPVNIDHKKHYNYEATQIISSGQISLINPNFIVHPTIDLSKDYF